MVAGSPRVKGLLEARAGDLSRDADGQIEPYLVPKVDGEHDLPFCFRRDGLEVALLDLLDVDQEISLSGRRGLGNNP